LENNFLQAHVKGHDLFMQALRKKGKKSRHESTKSITIDDSQHSKKKKKANTRYSLD
jgi:hypothetical protein